MALNAQNEQSKQKENKSNEVPFPRASEARPKPAFQLIQRPREGGVRRILWALSKTATDSHAQLETAIASVSAACGNPPFL